MNIYINAAAKASDRIAECSLVIAECSLVGSSGGR